MIKKVILASLLAITLFSCGEKNSIEDLKAVGGVRYGGVFRFMSSEKIESLFPLESTSLYSQRISAQIFETILKLDENGSKVIPAIAESYSVSPDGKTVTLIIRKNIFFHPDECLDGEGRELTADDVKFTLDMACSGLSINQISFFFKDRIVGAEEFYNETKKSFKEGGVSGITVEGKNKLVIKLKDAFTGFDNMLTYGCLGVFPREAYEFYKEEIRKHPVGTGPFMLESYTDKGIKLTRNPNYWAKDQFGNQLPFLEGIEMSYSENKRSELQAFRERKIDLVLEIPSEEVENILGSLQEAQEGKTVKHKVDSKPSFSVTFVGLSQKGIFKDVRIRNAFNHAISRESIVNNTIQGDGYPVLNGFIPSTPFYPAEQVKGPDYTVSKAQALLAQAGYPNGKGFPKMTIYVSGNKDAANHLMAKAVASQLKANLNIDLTVTLVSFEKRNEIVGSGKADMWISGWIADYPDGENFLSIFQGKYANTGSGFLNPFSYKNPKFDALYAKVNREIDETKRNQLLVQCDQMIVDDAVVLPLINDDFITMINSRIRNFSTNSLESLNFSKIFIKEPKDAEE